MIIKFGKYFITIIIHPMCAIEEYARIFRSCVWFSPPHPPTRADITPSVIISGCSTPVES